MDDRRRAMLRLQCSVRARRAPHVQRANSAHPAGDAIDGVRCDDRTRSGGSPACRRAAGLRAAHPRRDLPDRDDKARRRASRDRALALRRPARAVSRGGISRHRSGPVLRHGDRLRGVGPAVRAAAAEGAAPVPGDPRRSAPRGLHPRRPAVSHPRQAHGSVLRAGDADHGADRERGVAGRRGARLSLLRRPRSPRFRRRDGESARRRR